MICPKCKASVADNTLFCTHCGERLEKRKVCSDCGGSIPGDVLFCPLCGTSVSAKPAEVLPKVEPIVEITETAEKEVHSEESLCEEKEPKSVFENDTEAEKTAETKETDVTSRDDLERTMTIPVIKPKAQYAAQEPSLKVLAMPAHGANVTPGEKRPAEAYADRVSPKTAPSPRLGGAKVTSKPTRRKSSEQSGRNILIFIIVFLLVILIGFSGIFIYLSLNKNETPEETPVSQSSTAGEQTDENDNETNADDADEGNSESVAPFETKIDLGYAFAEGIELALDETEGIKYTDYRDDSYSLQYSVPESFGLESTGKREIRYSSEDATAYMDIGTMENAEGWTLENVKDAVLSELGGGAEYETDGSERFVIQTEKDGIFYYQKCYVTDESVCYVEFVFPKEYKSFYEEFVQEVGTSFKQKS